MAQQQTRWLLTLVFTLVLGIWLSRQPVIADFLLQSSPVQPTVTPIHVPTATPSPTWTLPPTPTKAPPTPTWTPSPTRALPTATPVPTATFTPPPTAIPTNPPPPPPPVQEEVLGETPTPLLPGYTPIPTYAPPLYIPRPEEAEPGPTEVATPWPTPIRVDRTRLPWRSFFPYVHYDWAYTYPFLRRRVYPTAVSAPKPSRVQRVLRVLRTLWHILPSFLCLGFALFLIMIEAILLMLKGRGRATR